jgi:hypothetical protein
MLQVAGILHDEGSNQQGAQVTMARTAACVILSDVPRRFHWGAVACSFRARWVFPNPSMGRTESCVFRRLVYGACVFLFAMVVRAPGQSMTYEESSERIYDAAKLVEPSVFLEDHLRDLMRQFTSIECKNRKLSRLIVAVDQRDLANITNVNVPPIRVSLIPDFVSPKSDLLQCEKLRRPVAQVLCFDGNATAAVRRDGKLTRFQLAGEHDSWDLTLLGVRLKLVGLRLHIIPSNIPARPLDQVWIYTRTEILPSLEKAKDMRREIEAYLGVHTTLFIRTDPFFITHEGPLCDPFEEPRSKMSKQQFLSEPYIACWSEEGGGECGRSTPLMDSRP